MTLTTLTIRCLLPRALAALTALTAWCAALPSQQAERLVGHMCMDCLRFKRWADGPQWLASRKLALSSPHSHMSYRYATAGGAAVTVDALVDQRRLSSKTCNNQEFLAAGRPALQWGRDLAQAVRVSTGMMDGYLAISPFPFVASGPWRTQAPQSAGLA